MLLVFNVGASRVKIKRQIIWGKKNPTNQQQQNSFGNKYQSLKEIVQE